MLVAENTLGRYLKDGEVVHHKDSDKRNNHPSNLIVFVSNGAHTAFHNEGCDESLLIPLEDGSFDYISLSMLCPTCGNCKSADAAFCLKCHRNSYYNLDDINEIIDDLIELDGNFTAVARKHNLTDNAIRKRIKKYGYPTHSYEWKSMIRSVAQSGESHGLINHKP